MIQRNYQGFTLIELMVAIIIFAIISLIGYRTIDGLITARTVMSREETKWNNAVNVITLINRNWHRAIPLTFRDENGVLQPAVIGITMLQGKYDSQLEFTIAGNVNTVQNSSTPPYRIGFRYIDNKLYMITWLYLNRAINYIPQVTLLADNITSFNVQFFVAGQWQNIWPIGIQSYDQIPSGIKIDMVLKSGEEIVRQIASE
jgi:general secretion pathway protein J